MWGGVLGCCCRYRFMDTRHRCSIVHTGPVGSGDCRIVFGSRGWGVITVRGCLFGSHVARFDEPGGDNVRWFTGLGCLRRALVRLGDLLFEGGEAVDDSGGVSPVGLSSFGRVGGVVVGLALLSNGCPTVLGGRAVYIPVGLGCPRVSPLFWLGCHEIPPGNLCSPASGYSLVSAHVFSRTLGWGVSTFVDTGCCWCPAPLFQPPYPHSYRVGGKGVVSDSGGVVMWEGGLLCCCCLGCFSS